MITFEYLKGLFDTGHYKDCLESLNNFLLFNTKDLDALFLKAKCHFEIADAENGDFSDAYDAFLAVLEIEPVHEKALMVAVYISIYITSQHIPIAITFCNSLLQSESLETRQIAFRYRAHAHKLSGNFESAIKDFDQLIANMKTISLADKGKADIELAALHEEKAFVYLWEMNEPEKALEVYKSGFDYLLPDFMAYVKIANLALQLHDYDFAGAAMIKGFSADNTEAVEESLQLFHKIDELLQANIVNKNLIWAKFIGWRVYGDALQADTLDVLIFARKYMEIYPDWYIPYHYAGTALFDAESLSEALPYLQKSLQLGGAAFGLYRFFVASFRLSGKFPEVEKWPEDNAIEYYNAGVTFFEAELELRNSKNAHQFFITRAKFYEKSYQIFHAYFFDNIGEAENNDIHTFAMCCNNYGLVLSNLNEYVKAEEIHQLGYSLSPFWEQLSSWGAVLVELKRYDEGLVKVQQAIIDSDGSMEFGNYLDLRGSEATALFYLGRIEETKTLLNNTESEYDTFIRQNKNELTEDELFILTERYIGIQNARGRLLITSSPEEAIKVWQDQLEKNPEDNSNWFMLMQNYYQVNDFKQCIACADNYLMIKEDALIAESAAKVYYMRGVSYFKTENFEKAIHDLNLVLDIHKSDYSVDEASIFDASRYLSEAYFKLKNWDKCLDFAQTAADFYSKNDWDWDDDLIAVLLLYADACHANDNKDAAIKTVDNILKNIPENEAAQQRKKEWKTGGFFSMFKKK